MQQEFSHLERKGAGIKMVDVGGKVPTVREAVARGMLTVSRELFDRLASDDLVRGNIFTTAKTAGVMAAKKTGDLIPLCHPLQLDTVEIEIALGTHRQEVRIECKIRLSGKTGAEMEALTGASVSALTVYDMCKSVDKGIIVSRIGLYKKTGGKSGEYLNPALAWDE